MISKIKDRVAIISVDNFDRISKLYGEVNIDDLERIVNKHIAVALDEIQEDLLNSNAMQKFNSKYPNRKEKDFEEC